MGVVGWGGGWSHDEAQRPDYTPPATHQAFHPDGEEGVELRVRLEVEEGRVRGAHVAAERRWDLEGGRHPERSAWLAKQSVDVRGPRAELDADAVRRVTGAGGDAVDHRPHDHRWGGMLLGHGAAER